jgi:hypothetical protein
MSQLFDLIKENAVPAAVRRAAAKGTLSLPPEQMIEILVYLTRDLVYGEEATMTLADWDRTSAIAVASSNTTPPEVLNYFWAEGNLFPRLLPALLENTAITEQQLIERAGVASREVLDMMLASPRVRNSPEVLKAMEAVAADPEVETAHLAWRQEHAAEIAAEEGKAFVLIDPDDEEKQAALQVPAVPATREHEFASDVRAMPMPPEQRKLSALQKVSRMTVAERIKTAFGGDKEERSLLVRDTSKVVQNAVLASPRLTDAEVETFAATKNLQENVFRELARNRKFIRNYSVVRNLVNNPRCPLDLGLTLIKNLLVPDLYHLQFNKNVPDTIRKVAFKMYVEKKSASKK